MICESSPSYSCQNSTAQQAQQYLDPQLFPSPRGNLEFHEPGTNTLSTSTWWKQDPKDKPISNGRLIPLCLPRTPRPTRNPSSKARVAASPPSQVSPRPAVLRSHQHCGSTACKHRCRHHRTCSRSRSPHHTLAVYPVRAVKGTRHSSGYRTKHRSTLAREGARREGRPRLRPS